ncbi:MAG: hypothetical protein H7A49_00910 [Akkermansiaceae bacterium]|nr:hypothetical protein [Akkermansiaceae bacterium]
MSRRSRKRRGGSRPAWQGKLALGFVLFLIVAAAGLFLAVRAYLHSDGFRSFLSAKVGEVARVDGSFSPFQWDGLAVRSKEYRATGGEMIRSLGIDDLRTEVGLGGLKRGVWEVRETSARRVEIEIDGRGRDETKVSPADSDPSEEARKSVPGWLPTKVEVMGLRIGEISFRALLDGGTIAADGMRLTCEPTRGGGGYDVTMSGGTAHAPYRMLPELRLDKARFRYEEGRIFLNHLSADAWSDAHLELSGEADRTTRLYSLDGGISNVKCEEAFDETWSRRASGIMESSLSLDNTSGKPVASGHAELHRGVLTALPVLDTLAAYADTRRFRTINLNEASTDWSWERGFLSFRNIRLGSEALLQLDGSLDIRDGNLDGRFLLGIAPGVLSSIPGAETDVFLPGERGLLWTPLHITGTLDNPEEDLTDRLIDAAGMRMFEIVPQTGEKVLRFSRAVLEEHVPDAMDKALDKSGEIIRDGGEIIRGAQGVLDDILRTPSPR